MYKMRGNNSIFQTHSKLFERFSYLFYALNGLMGREYEAERVACEW